MTRFLLPRRPPLRRRPARVLAALAVVVLSLPLSSLGAAPAHADAIREQQRWALDAINAPAAWATTRGAGVTVAVLDTGVDATHADLAGGVRKGRDFIGMGAEPGDPEWAVHGTAMAAIIAGRGHGPDRDSGVLGVAPEAEILPVRVLLEDDDPQRDEARASRSSALADGIRWATDQGVDVINLSLGDDSESAHPAPEEDAAVRYALRKGVVVVASAGNGGTEGNPVSYPAGYPGVIAVTAVDRTGGRAAFSTERWYATVSAPGKDVIVADPDGRYYSGWGTSAAAAFVSGSVALLRAVHPDLTPAQVKRLLTETAQDPPEGGRTDALGSGLVDAAAALEAAADLDSRASSPAAVRYQEEYFGPGPRPLNDGSSGTDWLAPAVGVAGGAFLVLGAWLLVRARQGARGATPPR